MEDRISNVTIYSFRSIALVILLSSVLLQSAWAAKEIPVKSNNKLEDEPAREAYEEDSDEKLKRGPQSYSFGLGKKDLDYGKEAGIEEAILNSLQDENISDIKRDGNDGLERFGFGLGKRGPEDRFAFGLGKRGPEDRFAFGLGKRGPEDRFAFGLGKRGPEDRFAFGLGKRSIDDRFAFGLGKRSIDDGSRFAFGLGKRGPEDRSDFGPGKRAPDGKRYVYGLGKREVEDHSFAFNLDPESHPLDFDVNKRGPADRFAFGLDKRENELDRSEVGLDKDKGSPEPVQGIEKRETFNDDIDEYIKRRFSFGLGK